MQIVCNVHKTILKCVLNGATVHFPIAQDIYYGDMWKCGVKDCPTEITVLAPTPFIQGYHDNYYAARDYATVKMWSV